MRKFLTILYALLAAACAGYYLLIGYSARFGLSMSTVWLGLTAAFAIAAALNAWRKTPKWVNIAIRELFAVGLTALIVLEGLVFTGMHARPAENIEYLIILGARVEQDGPSPALQRRLNAALEYLADHPEVKIVASGGQGADEPTSEAECIRDALVQAGIAPERILIEDQSTTTAENLRNSLNLIGDSEAPVAIVTNNFHVWRAVHLAEKAGFRNVSGLAAKYTGHTLFHYMTREAICIVAEFALGNL